MSMFTLGEMLGKCWFEVILRDVCSTYILRIRILGTHMYTCYKLFGPTLLITHVILGQTSSSDIRYKWPAKPQSPTQSWREMGTTRGKSSLNEPDQFAQICIVLHSEWTSVWELYPNTTYSYNIYIYIYYMHIYIYYKQLCLHGLAIPNEGQLPLGSSQSQSGTAVTCASISCAKGCKLFQGTYSSSLLECHGQIGWMGIYIWVIWAIWATMMHPISRYHGYYHSYYGHMFHSWGVNAMPMAAPGDGGIWPYLHRFRRFILFAWGPLLSEIWWLGWNVLELMRTTARRNMGSLVNYLLRTAAKQLGIGVVS